MVRRGERGSALIAALRSNSVICLKRRDILRCPRRFTASGERIGLRKRTFFSITGGRRRAFLVRARGMRVRMLKATFGIHDGRRIPFDLSI